MHYPAIFVREADGRYSVIFPGLSGCQTYGDDFDRALSNAMEALSLFVETAEADGETTPDRGPAPDSLAANQIVVAVPSIRDVGKLARVNISLDRGILAAIDAAARQRGQSRSGSWRAADAVERSCPAGGIGSAPIVLSLSPKAGKAASPRQPV